MRKGSRWGEVRGWIGVDASKTHVYLNADGPRDAHKIETHAHASNNNGWCLRLKTKMFHVTEFSEL